MWSKNKDGTRHFLASVGVGTLIIYVVSALAGDPAFPMCLHCLEKGWNRTRKALHGHGFFDAHALSGSS